jgi:hypothetical protein
LPEIERTEQTAEDVGEPDEIDLAFNERIKDLSVDREPDVGQGPHRQSTDL